MTLRHSLLRFLSLVDRVSAITFFVLVFVFIVQVIRYNQPTRSFLIVKHSSTHPRTTLSGNSEVTIEYRKRFNLLINDGQLPEMTKECTLDYVNTHKLPQDHPCVLHLIRSKFMNKPASRDLPYQLEDAKAHPELITINDAEIKHLLKNKRDGFFVECGALDGQMWSNTLEMEMNFNWTGLLIEGSPQNYKKLASKKRKAWTLPICLSLEPYPTKVLFVDSEDGKGAGSFHIVETDEEGNKKYDQVWDEREGQVNQGTVQVQCFPFYSVLLAANRTVIDYLSLDVEGHEMKILQTIPWDRVDIKTIRLEWLKIPPRENLSGEAVLTEYMEGEPGYIKFHQNEYDSVYFKDYINNQF